MLKPESLWSLSGGDNASFLGSGVHQAGVTGWGVLSGGVAGIGMRVVLL